jgi:hypothetical protein
MKKTTAHGRKLKRQETGKAMADFLANMRGYLVSVSTKAYLTAEGEFAPVLLGDLAALLAVGAEISATKLPGTTEAKSIHAALRTTVAMSIDARRWRLTQAKVMHEAAEMSSLLFMKWPALGIAVSAGVFELAQEVRNGTARMDAVAGAEVYAKQAVSA